MSKRLDASPPKQPQKKTPKRSADEAAHKQPEPSTKRTSTPRVRIERKGAKRADVGFARPPREHRFKAGQSGNPKGRPKGSKNESTLLREILQRTIETRAGGRSRKISILEGILRRVVEDSLRGNIKSAAFVLNRYAAMVSGDLQPADMSDDDREILEAFAQRLGGERTVGKDNA